MPAPPVPDDVVFGDLDRTVRARLRSLTKDNAERVGRHLVVVGRLLDEDPELAYEHAQAAVRRAGRIDVVREAAGLAAYRTGRYAEALRELRTVRRLNGSSEHLPVMADCERGLGRPERAIALAQEPEAETLDAAARVELAIVVSGARLDLGQSEAAVAVLATSTVQQATGVLAVRVAQARATALDAAGRPDDAAAELARYTAAQLAEAAGEPDADDVVVFDLDEDEDDDERPGTAGGDEDETGASRVEPGEADATDEDGETDALPEVDAADSDELGSADGEPDELDAHADVRGATDDGSDDEEPAPDDDREGVDGDELGADAPDEDGAGAAGGGLGGPGGGDAGDEPGAGDGTPVAASGDVDAGERGRTVRVEGEDA